MPGNTSEILSQKLSQTKSVVKPLRNSTGDFPTRIIRLSTERKSVIDATRKVNHELVEKSGLPTDQVLYVNADMMQSSTAASELSAKVGSPSAICPLSVKTSLPGTPKLTIFSKDSLSGSQIIPQHFLPRVILTREIMKGPVYIPHKAVLSDNTYVMPIYRKPSKKTIKKRKKMWQRGFLAKSGYKPASAATKDPLSTTVKRIYKPRQKKKIPGAGTHITRSSGVELHVDFDAKLPDNGTKKNKKLLIELKGANLENGTGERQEDKSNISQIEIMPSQSIVTILPETINESSVTEDYFIRNNVNSEEQVINLTDFSSVTEKEESKTSDDVSASASQTNVIVASPKNDTILAIDINNQDNMKITPTPPYETKNIDIDKGWQNNGFILSDKFLTTKYPATKETGKEYTLRTIEAKSQENEVVPSFSSGDTLIEKKVGLNEDLQTEHESVIVNEEKTRNETEIAWSPENENDKVSAFVSDAFDEYLTCSSKLNISFEIPKNTTSDCISKVPADDDYNPENIENSFKLIKARQLLINEYSSARKPKTLLEKRLLLEEEKCRKQSETHSTVVKSCECCMNTDSSFTCFCSEVDKFLDCDVSPRRLHSSTSNSSNSSPEKQSTIVDSNLAKFAVTAIIVPRKKLKLGPKPKSLHVPVPRIPVLKPDSVIIPNKVPPKSFGRSKMERELHRLGANIVNCRSVPREVGPSVPKEDCDYLHCQLGCVCDSLNAPRHSRDHCGKVECMFHCNCISPQNRPHEIRRLQMLSSEEITWIAQSQIKNFAKEEQKFKTTVISQDSITVVQSRGKREQKLPAWLRDSSSVILGKELESKESLQVNYETTGISFASRKRKRIALMCNALPQILSCVVSLRKLDSKIDEIGCYCTHHKSCTCQCINKQQNVALKRTSISSLNSFKHQHHSRLRHSARTVPYQIHQRQIYKNAVQIETLCHEYPTIENNPRAYIFTNDNNPKVDRLTSETCNSASDEGLCFATLGTSTQESLSGIPLESLITESDTSVQYEQEETNDEETFQMPKIVSVSSMGKEANIESVITYNDCYNDKMNSVNHADARHIIPSEDTKTCNSFNNEVVSKESTPVEPVRHVVNICNIQSNNSSSIQRINNFLSGSFAEVKKLNFKCTAEKQVMPWRYFKEKVKHHEYILWYVPQGGVRLIVTTEDKPPNQFSVKIQDLHEKKHPELVQELLNSIYDSESVVQDLQETKENALFVMHNGMWELIGKLQMANMNKALIQQLSVTDAVTFDTTPKPSTSFTKKQLHVVTSQNNLESTSKFERPIDCKSGQAQIQPNSGDVETPVAMFSYNANVQVPFVPSWNKSPFGFDGRTETTQKIYLPITPCDMVWSLIKVDLKMSNYLSIPQLRLLVQGNRVLHILQIANNPNNKKTVGMFFGNCPMDIMTSAKSPDFDMLFGIYALPGITTHVICGPYFAKAVTGKLLLGHLNKFCIALLDKKDKVFTRKFRVEPLMLDNSTNNNRILKNIPPNLSKLNRAISKHNNDVPDDATLQQLSSVSERNVLKNERCVDDIIDYRKSTAIPALAMDTGVIDQKEHDIATTTEVISLAEPVLLPEEMKVSIDTEEIEIQTSDGTGEIEALDQESSDIKLINCANIDVQVRMPDECVQIVNKEQNDVLLQDDDTSMKEVEILRNEISKKLSVQTSIEETHSSKPSTPKEVLRRIKVVHLNKLKKHSPLVNIHKYIVLSQGGKSPFVNLKSSPTSSHGLEKRELQCEMFKMIQSQKQLSVESQPEVQLSVINQCTSVDTSCHDTEPCTSNEYDDVDIDIETSGNNDIENNLRATVGLPPLCLKLPTTISETRHRKRSVIITMNGSAVRVTQNEDNTYSVPHPSMPSEILHFNMLDNVKKFLFIVNKNAKPETIKVEPPKPKLHVIEPHASVRQHQMAKSSCVRLSRKRVTFTPRRSQESNSRLKNINIKELTVRTEDKFGSARSEAHNALERERRYRIQELLRVLQSANGMNVTKPINIREVLEKSVVTIQQLEKDAENSKSVVEALLFYQDTLFQKYNKIMEDYPQNVKDKIDMELRQEFAACTGSREPFDSTEPEVNMGVLDYSDHDSGELSSMMSDSISSRDAASNSNSGGHSNSSKEKGALVKVGRTLTAKAVSCQRSVLKPIWKSSAPEFLPADPVLEDAKVQPWLKQVQDFNDEKFVYEKKDLEYEIAEEEETLFEQIGIQDPLAITNSSVNDIISS